MPQHGGRVAAQINDGARLRGAGASINHGGNLLFQPLADVQRVGERRVLARHDECGGEQRRAVLGQVANSVLAWC